MCGIAGIINFNYEPVSIKILEKMTRAIAHRGPDGEGFFVDGHIGLGHRRLAIIDLSKMGIQPMFTTDKRYAIVYNGEIYNFRELKKELEKIGYSFKSSTDTEVILYSYVQWGVDCVKHFNGMFCFVIWDSKTKELFIARDRYGVKPLYYSFIGNSFIFGSEQKVIIQHPEFKKNLDLEGMLEYFTFQNIFTEKTLFQGVSIFPAGYYAKIDIKNNSNKLNLVNFWDFDFKENQMYSSKEEYIEELQRLFKQAVERQLVSDVELGAYLSGGIDSGSITAIAASKLPYIKSFTCGFDLSSASGLELGFDERQKAEYMSSLFKTEHYEMVLKAGDMERIMPNLVLHVEEPRVGQSYPNYYVSQLASKFVKVVLSGTGGDELFAGYPWRYYTAISNDNFEDYIDNYYNFWQRLIPSDITADVFSPVWRKISHVSTRDIFKSVFQTYAHELTRPEDYVNHSLYFESKTFLHGLLIIEDKLSMAHSLETRVPFLDNDLVDFAMKVPARFKLKNLTEIISLNENDPGPKTTNYYNKTKDGKLLFREAMSKFIPPEIAEGKKQGFSAPDASWFRGESIEYIKRILLDKNANIYNFMDFAAIKTLLNQHLEGKQNRRLLIWSLLNFEIWCKKFILG
ncbi:MAG: asparagine synthase (glutamine-hydrolyzing) [Deltaproteobacteria bacterium]